MLLNLDLLQVFLTIHDDFEKSLQSFSGSTVKPKYSIVLVSPTPIDWIISFENNITDYQFYVRISFLFYCNSWTNLKDNFYGITLNRPFELSSSVFLLLNLHSIVCSCTLIILKVISIIEFSIRFFFQVTSDSTVRSGSSSLPSESLQFSVSISFGRHFHGCQIKNKFCKTYKCHLTTFLQLQSVDSLQLTVGVFNESG